MAAGQWDVRETSAFDLSASVDYTDWDGWNGKSIHVGSYTSFGGWLNTDFGNLWNTSVGIAGTTLVVTDSGDSGNTATFSVTPGLVSNLASYMQFEIDSIISQTGTPPTSFTGTDGWIYTLTASPSFKTVIFDTNQTGTELVPAATYTDNSGDVVLNQISNTFGSLDAFTLTLDSSHAASPITGTYSSQAGYIQRATELKTAIDAATTTDLLVSANAVAEVYDFTFNDITLTAAEYDNSDQVGLLNMISTGNGILTVRPGGSNSAGNVNRTDAGFAFTPGVNTFSETQDFVDHINTIDVCLYTAARIADGQVRFTAKVFGIITDVSVQNNGGANSAAFGAAGSLFISGSTFGAVSIDSSTVGDRTDASFLVVAGTASTTSDTVTVQVQGVDGVGRSATVMNLLNADTTNGHTLASYSATIANAVSGVELGYHAQLGYIAVGNYSTTTPSTTSFNALSEMAGAESNISLTFTPGTKVDGTVADVNITNTVVIEGADAFNTGFINCSQLRYYG